MKEKIRTSDENAVADILFGLRTFAKPVRSFGRLKQLNKHAKKMKRLYSPVTETDADSRC